MSENIEQQNESIPSNEFLIAEIAKIQTELNELKNLKEQAFRSSSNNSKRAVRKTVKKRTAVKRKPAKRAVRKTVKKRTKTSPRQTSRRKPTKFRRRK